MVMLSELASIPVVWERAEVEGLLVKLILLPYKRGLFAPTVGDDVHDIQMYLDRDIPILPILCGLLSEHAILFTTQGTFKEDLKYRLIMRNPWSGQWGTAQRWRITVPNTALLASIDYDLQSHYIQQRSSS